MFYICILSHFCFSVKTAEDCCCTCINGLVPPSMQDQWDKNQILSFRAEFSHGELQGSFLQQFYTGTKPTLLSASHPFSLHTLQVGWEGTQLSFSKPAPHLKRNHMEHTGLSWLFLDCRRKISNSLMVCISAGKRSFCCLPPAPGISPSCSWKGFVWITFSYIKPKGETHRLTVNHGQTIAKIINGEREEPLPMETELEL